MSLTLVIPYCTKDVNLTKNLLDWIHELQPSYPENSCLLAADHEVSQTDKLDIQNRAKRCFDSVQTMVVRVPAERQNWPDGPNVMFASVARQIHETYKEPWLWLEPDAVPLGGGWLWEIEKAYRAQPKRCMGSLIAADNQPDVPPVHLSGVSVYPANLWPGIEGIMKNPTKPFDILLAPYLVPRAENCSKMQHYWGEVGNPPTFKEFATPVDSKNVLSLDFIKPNAVLFHRCKDGSLIDVLRQRRLRALEISPIVQESEAPLPKREEPGENPVLKKRGRPRKNEVVETQ